MEKEALLRKLPKVDELLREESIIEDGKDMPPAAVTDCVRERLSALRESILKGRIDTLPTREALLASIAKDLALSSLPSLRPVINGTGVILHTNLGRAPLSKRACLALEEAAENYGNLEYDLEQGCRGSRYVHCQSLLKKLTGAQSAMVVNNNAAAVLLILSALSKGGEVPVSRGELVEIGGAFRVPEIMEQCGCTLREVGTTNKTRLSDYEKAVGENTRALLKVHTSNFRVVGFTESVSIEELASLGKEKGLPVIVDLGSGALADIEQMGVRQEPTVQSCLAAGADVLCFSGDKLLGGPQAGIILGKKEYMDILLAHPLTRALRVDKLTLSALYATLYAYLDKKTQREIPVVEMLSLTEEELSSRAALLQQLLKEQGIFARSVPVLDTVGGGSAPLTELPGRGLAFKSDSLSPNALEERLRLLNKPVIGRIEKDTFLLSMRTLFPRDFAYIAKALGEVLV